MDAIQIYEPYVDQLVRSGKGHIWYTAAGRGLTSYTSLYAPRRFLVGARGTPIRPALPRSSLPSGELMRIIASVVVLGLAACASPDPTPADRMRTTAATGTGLADQWDRGAVLIQQGEEQVNQGNREITTGEENVREGRRKIDEGRRLKAEAERQYQERFPVPR